MGSEPAEALMPRRVQQLELLERLGKICWRLHIRAFLVGGPVRDLLLGLAGPDLDIAVEGDSREAGRRIAEELGGRFVYHSRFFTGTVTLDKSKPGAPDHIDITRTRTETYAGPATLPRVKPASIEQDLGRRDFTINAMAYSLAPAEFGRFLDPYNGRIDLARRAIRVLHDQSFIDDPTRAFRAIRFAVRFGFAVEPHTLKLLRECITQGTPSLLTPERILYELRLICAEPRAIQMLETTSKEGLLASCFGNEFTLVPSFFSSLRRLSRKKARLELLYLYVLSILPLTGRFPITREERDATSAIRQFPQIRDALLSAPRPSAVHHLLAPIPPPALELLSIVEPAPVSRRIVRHLTALSRVNVSTTGADLRRFGLPPGPCYRHVLDRLLYARLDRQVTSDQAETRLARILVKRALARISGSPDRKRTTTRV